MKSCKESVLLKRREDYTFSHTTGSHAKPNHATRKSGQSHKPCDLCPHTLAPRLPDVCEKKTFSASFVPQPAENNTLLVV